MSIKTQALPVVVPVFQFTELSPEAQAQAMVEVRKYADSLVDQARAKLTEVRGLHHLPKEEQPKELDSLDAQASRVLTKALRLDHQLVSDSACLQYLKKDEVGFTVSGHMAASQAQEEK